MGDKAQNLVGGEAERHRPHDVRHHAEIVEFAHRPIDAEPMHAGAGIEVDHPRAFVDLGAGNTLTNAGSLSPGGQGTVLTTALTGNFFQGSSGKFLVDIKGGNADRVNATGSAAVDGKLRPDYTLASLGSSREWTMPHRDHSHHRQRHQGSVHARGAVRCDLPDGHADGPRGRRGLRCQRPQPQRDGHRREFECGVRDREFQAARHHAECDCHTAERPGRRQCSRTAFAGDLSRHSDRHAVLQSRLHQQHDDLP